MGLSKAFLIPSRKSLFMPVWYQALNGSDRQLSVSDQIVEQNLPPLSKVYHGRREGQQLGLESRTEVL